MAGHSVLLIASSHWKQWWRNTCCSKKILLLLVWQVLFSYSLGLLDDGYLSIFLFRSSFLWLCCAPLVSRLADVRFGRNKVVIFGALALLSVGLFYMIATGGDVSILFDYLLPAATFIGSFSVACYAAAMLPFVVDQLYGATSDELTTAVRWYYWAENCGYGLSDLFKNYHIQEHTSGCGEIAIIFTILPAVIIVSDCLCQQWLDRTNPIKLIIQVLNKHSYPEKCSAYIDEEQPARIDCGKDTQSCSRTLRVEEEDIKTVLRLVPLMICLNLFLNTFEASATTIFKSSDVADIFWNLRLGTWPFALLLIPFSQLLLSRCVSKCSSSVLQCINAGFFMCIVGFMLISVTGVYQLIVSEDTVLSCGVIVTAMWPVSYVEWYWRLCPCFVWGIGKTIAYIVILEFVIAQSPDKVKRLVYGILLGCRGIISLVFEIVKQFNFTLCYTYSLSLVLVVLFVVFLVLSKRYILRERNREINIQAIVEEHYERYMDQEEEYMRQQHY